MLGMPKKISLEDLAGKMHHDIDMWRFWQLEEGVLQLPPEVLQTNDGKVPPVIHVDTDAPLHSCVDGSVITEDLWGIYYKPDWHFNGVQGGASPCKVDTPVERVAIDPYGPSSPEFVASDDFAHAEIGTELEVGRLDGDQLRLPAKIVAFPHFDPKKERVKGNYKGARGG
jgi:hypothetical protein